MTTDTPITERKPVELVEMYITLRDKKEAASTEFKKSMERTNQAMEKLEAMLLSKLEELGVDSLTSKGIGTVYRNVQNSATVTDKAAFREWLEITGNWESTDLRANKAVIRQLLDEGTQVPGVKFSSINTVGVRRG